MNRIKKAEETLAGLENGLLVLLILILVSLSFLQVLLRLFFKTGILWADPLLRHMVLWTAFLGAALAMKEGKHFAWEAAAQRPGRLGAAFRLIAQLATAAVSALLTQASWSYLQEEKTSGDIALSLGSRSVPAWIFACAIPTGFALILVHSLISAAASAKDFTEGGRDVRPPASTAPKPPL